MMDLLLATSGGESQSATGGYVDDVFSAYTYTGNGSTQTINNGIDLAGKGGLVWTKSRTAIEWHHLIDTVRGNTKALNSNDSGVGFTSSTYITSFNNSGYSLGLSTGVNGSSQNVVSWTFRKAPKFFDIVTYTGNGASNRTLSHQLNADVGMITVKATSTTGDWWVFHRSATGDLVLNTTAAQTASKANIPSATTSTFTVNGSANTSGVTYVAYLWAHDPSTEGIIQCESFTTDGGGNATVNLGWEPQYVLWKSVGSGDSWQTYDSMRGWTVGGNDAVLYPNNSATEDGTANIGNPTATGMANIGAIPSRTYIYLAIRRPNKPPTSGTQVYNAIARTGTGAAATVTGVGFAPDYLWSKARAAGNSPTVFDRMRGRKFCNTSATVSEFSADNATDPVTSWDEMNGIKFGTDSFSRTNYPSETFIHHFFRRAPCVFDVVCDTGTGAAHAIAHNLTKAPELIIRKSRSTATQWEVWHSALAATEKLVLNSTDAKATDTAAWNSTFPTSTQFTVGTGANVNTNAATYVTYLFATLAGISKAGSYTGNGTSQTINCGFATGARLILIKRTDATGDWYVWDSVRGIIAANDPHLSLNTTATEITTDDSVDPEASGFIVNQNTATNINVNGGQYIFLSIA